MNPFSSRCTMGLITQPRHYGMHTQSWNDSTESGEFSSSEQAIMSHLTSGNETQWMIKQDKSLGASRLNNISAEYRKISWLWDTIVISHEVVLAAGFHMAKGLLEFLYPDYQVTCCAFIPQPCICFISQIWFPDRNYKKLTCKTKM